MTYTSESKNFFFVIIEYLTLSPLITTQSAPEEFLFSIQVEIWIEILECEIQIFSPSLVYYRMTLALPPTLPYMDRACWTAIRYVSILTLYCNKRIKVPSILSFPKRSCQKVRPQKSSSLLYPSDEKPNESVIRFRLESTRTFFLTIHDTPKLNTSTWFFGR